MRKYVFNRLIWAIPTLFFITLIGFILSVNSPVNPIDIIVGSNSQNLDLDQNSVQEKQKRYWRKKLGLDLPLFYFSIHPLSQPDTLYKIENPLERYSLKVLSKKHGNWEAINEYYQNLKEWKAKLMIDKQHQLSDSVNDELLSCQQLLSQLLTTHNSEDIILLHTQLHVLIGKNQFLNQYEFYLKESERCFNDFDLKKYTYKCWFPKITFYPDNQYHRWLFGDGNFFTGNNSTYSSGVIRGDFGISYAYMKPVSEVISGRIGWTLFFSFLSIFMAFAFSIPLGLKSAASKGQMFDKIVNFLLLVLYSVPGFFMATLLQYLLSSPFGIELFETTGVRPTKGFPEHASIIEKIKISVPYIILPFISFTYSSLAFLFRTVRSSSIDVLELDYIRTARAKGLHQSTIMNRHVFRNSLLPLITIFASAIPVSLGGSVILEYIFGIPGIGLEIYSSIQRNDFPVVIAIFTLSGILTTCVYIIADILYALADPRIKFKNNR